MSKAVKGIFGGGSSQAEQQQRGMDQQIALMKQQQEEQRARIEAETRRASEIEMGQRRARSGGSGFLAFVDERLSRKKFGG